MVRTRTSGSCMRRLSLSICGNTVELAPNLMTILVHHPVNDGSICQSAPNLCVSAYVLYGRLCHRCFPGIGTTVNIVSASIIMPSSINPAVHMVTHTTPCTCFFLVSNLCLLPHYLVPFQKKNYVWSKWSLNAVGDSVTWIHTMQSNHTEPAIRFRYTDRHGVSLIRSDGSTKQASLLLTLNLAVISTKHSERNFLQIESNRSS